VFSFKFQSYTILKIKGARVNFLGYLKQLPTYFLVFSLAGCATLVRMPEEKNIPTSSEAQKAWSRVLAEFVNQKGEVNFKGLLQKRADLDKYVLYVSKVNPAANKKDFPDEMAVLAHHINAYNALSMYNVLDSELPESLSGFKKVKFFYFKKFRIGGQEMSLYTCENDIIRKMGEERIHFALNCMSRGCPRLPRVPFTAKKLNQELEEQARFFFSEERNVQVDEKEKTVKLSEILDFFPEDFLKKAKSLIGYANRYRVKGKELPETFKEEFIPYDWRVNHASIN